MTKYEALQSLILFEVPTNLIEKALIDSDIIGTESYSKQFEREIDLCFAGLCLFLANIPDVKEGDLSITYDRNSLLNARTRILEKYNTSDSGINSIDIW